jgi:hypothetical protein
MEFKVCALTKTQTEMISPQDLPALIEKTLPELSGICNKNKCRNVYDTVRQMLLYTHSKVIRHNMKAAQQCMALAEQLYKKGNTAIKCAIENVFVYSFSRIFFQDEKIKSEIVKIVPVSLYELYRKQVISSHL